MVVMHNERLSDAEWRAAAPTVGPLPVIADDVRDRLVGSLRTALDHGHTTGTAIGQDCATWVCLTWQEIGPKWVAVAIADSDTEDGARTLAAERLVIEVARHAP